jgi:hypothetical protein
MARHFLQSIRPLAGVARKNIEVVATLAAMAAAAVVPPRISARRGAPHVQYREGPAALVSR